MKKIALTLVITASTLFAAQAHTPATGIKPKDPIVSYAGTSHGEMLINLQFENTDNEKFEVVIIDKDGNRLYNDVYADKKVNKTFKTPSDIGTLVFIVRNTRSKTEQKFEISTERRLVEDVQVTRLN